MSQACGHIDFYPNNGKEQPGCALSQEGGTLIPLTLIKDGIEEASRVLLACNHVRAIKLFIDSINGKCPYVGRCSSNLSNSSRFEIGQMNQILKWAIFVLYYSASMSIVSALFAWALFQVQHRQLRSHGLPCNTTKDSII